MKKNLFCMWLALLAILFTVNMEAQMTIGGKKEPEAFSVLELLNKGGLRLPQMTTAQRNAFAVKNNDKGEGLTIYNIDTKCVEYWNATRWVSLCEGTSQTKISPQPCVNVAADGTGCDQTFTIDDVDCPNGPFNIAIVAGSEYAVLNDVDNTNGKFKIDFFPNESVNIHTVLVRVTSTCTSLFKEFLFSQNGVDCTSMPYTAPTITASATTICIGGAVYLSVPANTPNLDKLIWTRNGVEVARGVNYYIATQKGEYNISMGAVGCNKNDSNKRTITESGTATPVTLSVIASNNGEICGTNKVTLTASGNSSGTIVWFHNGVQEQSGPSIDLSSDTSIGEWFAAVKDGSCYSKQSNSIQVKKTAAGGQITIDDADVLVNGKPLSSFTSFCAGGSLNFSIANKQNGITYTWYNGNDPITTNPFIVPGNQSTMSLRMIATDNSDSKCPAETHVLEKNITSGNTPGQPSITGKTVLCDGSTDLTIVPETTGTYTYTWYKDNVKISEAQTITVSEGGTYNATVTNATGCTSTMAVKNVSSTVSSQPVITWLSNPASANFGGKVYMEASSTPAATSYTWAADNGAVITGSGASVSVQLPASGIDGLKVKVTVTAKNDCGEISKDHLITVNTDCPTPEVTASNTVQTTTTNSAVTLSASVTAATAVQAAYKWYSNTTNSNSGGTEIPGATTASYTYTPSQAGTYYFYCEVTNGCTGNPKGNSPAFTVTASKDPSTINPGSGSLSGRTCFDIAQTEGGDTCGPLSSRLPQQADFTTVINTQQYTFTPQGTISNLHFQYVEKSGYANQIVSKFEPNGNTVTVTYNTNLSGAQGTALGKTSTDPLYVTIYAIFNDGTGAEVAVKLKAEIKDCMCCGAKISATEWRAFKCHNMGVDESLNPFSADARLTGNYYYWGTLLPYNAGGKANTTSWADNVKTASDPCPPGYRVPTRAEWQGVVSNNVTTKVYGSFAFNQGTVVIGPALPLPVSSYVPVGVGQTPLALAQFSYQSTTVYSANSNFYYLYGSSSTTFNPNAYAGRSYAFPVRCIQKAQGEGGQP
ncbi:hypothetical protein [Flavobacterium panici]|uniref:Ig-like domain-containing protein n=1 Tax=Flavobacterium panici TaxID=2654843 RepID=A0A9N8J516_9FLAO|nr:hypothetical protein [Flavobacterium panici]CAC9975701.1 hypothetical protein FLAPXU55_03417 [Flavobacterium panici]